MAANVAEGQRLGKYEIVRPLAVGGMAQLYLAKIAGIGAFERYVVVKVIMPERSHDAMAIKMFLDEARLAASLHHNNVAQVIEVGAENHLHYFVMEYVHGQDLRAILARCGELGRRIPLEIALQIVVCAAAGLHHAHDRKGPDGAPLRIVHRDVSPSNVMIDYDGAVKMVDFGIAKATERSAETQAGTIKGKFAYMSPEQCRGLELDRRSDVFALGIILYESTTQQRAFRADSDFETMQRIVQGKYRRPMTIYPDYPPGLQAIVERALQVEPKQRYQTAGELMEAIEKFAIAERLALSAIALGRFMKDLFGEVPEPWVGARAAATAQPSPRPREYTVSDAEARALKQAQPVGLDSDTESDGGLDLDAPTIPVPLTKDGAVDHAKLRTRGGSLARAANTAPPVGDLAALPTKVDKGAARGARPDDGDTEPQPGPHAGSQPGNARETPSNHQPGGAVASASLGRGGLPIAPATRTRPSPSTAQPIVPAAGAPRLSVPAIAQAVPPASVPPAPAAKSPPAAALAPLAKRPDTRAGGFGAPATPALTSPATPLQPQAADAVAPGPTTASATTPAAVVPPPLASAASQPPAAAVFAAPAPLTASVEMPRHATFAVQSSQDIAHQLRPSRRGLWIALIGLTAIAIAAVWAVTRSSAPIPSQSAVLRADAGVAPPPVDAPAATVDAVAVTPPRDGGSLMNAGSSPPLLQPAKVRVTSSPAGADVYLGKRRVGKTPYELSIEPGTSISVRIEERGYRSESLSIGADSAAKHVKLQRLERVKSPPRADPCAPATYDALRCNR